MLGLDWILIIISKLSESDMELNMLVKFSFICIILNDLSRQQEVISKVLVVKRQQLFLMPTLEALFVILECVE